jgi:2'-5' RNA ligase
MAQSVELLFDQRAEEIIRAAWERLAEVGLPSEYRAPESLHHRPHLTLFAADEIAAESEERLPGLVSGLALKLQIGAPMFFAQGRRRFILVRHVPASVPLLEVQRRVAHACRADDKGQFGPARWSPHITVARRLDSRQAGRALALLGVTPSWSDVDAEVIGCRRWDGDRKTAWLL